MNPDIILVVVDCLRYDITHSLLSTIAGSLHSGRCIRDGHMMFERCLAAGPYTWISMPVITTGLPALLPDHPILSNRLNIADIMRSAGYYTVAYITNPVVEVQRCVDRFDVVYRGYYLFRSLYSGIEQSVRRYTGTRVLNTLSCSLAATLRSLEHKLRVGVTNIVWKSCQEILSESTRLLLNVKRVSPKPVFLYIHLMDLHFPAPYGIRESSICGILKVRPGSQDLATTKLLVSKYATMASLVLTNVIRFTRTVSRNLKEYIIVVTSDHGELLGEFGIVGHEGIPIRAKSSGLFKSIFVPQLIVVPLLVFSSYEIDIVKAINSSRITHYDIFWTIVKECNYDYYKANLDILALYRRLEFYTIEANRYLVWGRGFYGEQYCFITDKGSIITESNSDYTRFMLKWKFIKRILWTKLRIKKRNTLLSNILGAL